MNDRMINIWNVMLFVLVVIMIAIAAWVIKVAFIDEKPVRALTHEQAVRYVLSNKKVMVVRMSCNVLGTSCEYKVIKDTHNEQENHAGR